MTQSLTSSLSSSTVLEGTLSRLQQDYKASRDAQEPWDREWKLNLAFLSGKQWVRWNKVSSTVDRVREISRGPGDRKRKRPVHNRLLPNFQIVTSALTSFIPRCIVVPGTPDPDDKAGARVSTALVDHHRRKAKMEAQMANGVDLAVGLGTSVVWGEWNPYANRPLEIEGAVQNSGDFAVKVLPPWQVYPDPTAQSPEETAWIDIVDIMPQEEAARRFEMPLSYFPASKDRRLQNFSELYSASGLRVQGGQRQDKPDTEIHHRFDMPCAVYPRGRWIIWTNGGDKDGNQVGGIIREEKELPYGMMEFPLGIITFNRLPCQWYGLGLITAARAPQASRNADIGRMQEWMGTNSSPPLKITEGSMRPEEERNFSGVPGSKVKVFPGVTPPEFMKPPPSPDMKNFMVSTDDIDNAMSVPEVARGKSPTRDRISGVAVEGLRAEYQQALGKTLKEIIRCLEHVHKVGLYIAAEKYTDFRMFYILGKNRSQAWFQIGGKQQEGVEEGNFLSFDGFRKLVKSGCDVVVEADPGVPQTRSERRREVFMLAQIPPPLWKLLGYGMTEDLWAAMGMGAFSQTMNLPGNVNPQEVGESMAQQGQGGPAMNVNIPPEILESM